MDKAELEELKKSCVLLVGSDARTLKKIRNFLREFVLIAAGSGQEALAVVRAGIWQFHAAVLHKQSISDISAKDLMLELHRTDSDLVFIYINDNEKQDFKGVTLNFGNVSADSTPVTITVNSLINDPLEVLEAKTASSQELTLKGVEFCGQWKREEVYYGTLGWLICRREDIDLRAAAGN